MKILLTKKLPDSSLNLIQSWGWQADFIEALNINPVVVHSLPVKSDAWIISSRNSLPAVLKFIDHAPRIIFCIGEWIPKELYKAGGDFEIRSFENMNSIAKEILRLNIAHCLYFCGDHHRNDLEQGLNGHSVIITKVITHESHRTFPILEKNYDAIFVFSPRSVDSLLKNNRFDPQTIFACIGPTTLSSLAKYGIINSFCASYPESDLLLKEFYMTTIPKNQHPN